MNKIGLKINDGRIEEISISKVSEAGTLITTTNGRSLSGFHVYQEVGPEDYPEDVESLIQAQTEDVKSNILVASSFAKPEVMMILHRETGEGMQAVESTITKYDVQFYSEYANWSHENEECEENTLSYRLGDSDIIIPSHLEIDPN